MNKVLPILLSVRFWLISLATASVIAGHYAPSLKFLFDQLAIWLAAVAAIGTVDKFSAK